MFKQRLMFVVAALVAGMWAQAAAAQCRGGNNSMGGGMGRRGPMNAGQMMNGGPMMAYGRMMNSGQTMNGQMQGQGGGMCMGQRAAMGSNMGNLSAMPQGFSGGMNAQMTGGIYAQMLPSSTTSQSSSSSLGVRRGQTLQQSVLATFDTNGDGKLQGAEFKAAQLAASQRRQHSRGR